VDVKGKGDDAEVFLRSDGQKVTGLAVIALEPKELTVVHVEGTLDPESLGKLGGKFGIPKIETKKQP